MRRRISFIHGMVSVVVIMVSLAVVSCGTYLTTNSDRGMEKYAEERYAHALKFMEAGRFELAREQFAIVNRIAVSPELKALAAKGQDKAVAVIEAKR
ncbi:MAG: hypothetical protein KKD63_11865 [Proteobacteria bacterium]|nr:hypothetical protein [Desulfobulbaceae bacterium]MBU4153569.1 hypothetical protein [Pseudomonadota bacterium]MDP2104918.1 hypothetical protein [Desulfobulbaceae bacterium]